MQVLNNSFYSFISYNVLPLGGHQDHLGFEALSPSGQNHAQMNHHQELYEVVKFIVHAQSFLNVNYCSMQSCENQGLKQAWVCCH